MMGLLCDPSVIVIDHLDTSLRVVRLADSAPGGETLSFEEATDFNPQERFILFMTISLGWRILP